MRKLIGKRVIAASAIAVAAAIAGPGTVAPAMSHHSFAMYTNQYRFSFVGAVVAITPEFNHQVMSFVVVNADRTDFARRAPTPAQVAAGQPGTPVLMSTEHAGSAQAANQGLHDLNFPAGTVISVAFFPLRQTVNQNPLTHPVTSTGGGDQVGPVIRCPLHPTRNTWTVLPPPGQFCQDLEGSQNFGGGAANIGNSWDGAVEWAVAAMTPGGIGPVAAQGAALEGFSQNF